VIETVVGSGCVAFVLNVKHKKMTWIETKWQLDV